VLRYIAAAATVLAPLQPDRESLENSNIHRVGLCQSGSFGFLGRELHHCGSPEGSCPCTYSNLPTITFQSDELLVESSPIHQMIKFFKADATMLFSHMLIARVARPEDRHTHPTDVRPATSARYMIATFRLLHRCLAFRTIFDV
jgi:hypothetical protein